MQYSDTSGLSGIIQEEERLTGLGYTGISSSTNNLKEFTSLNNIESSKIWHLIFTSNGNWTYDDGNQSDLPFGATDLVSGTSKYALPEGALVVKRIEIKDANGTWFRLDPITLEEIGTKGNFLTDSGTSNYYTLTGNTIELFPAPNYNSTGGLKVFFERESVAFTTSDTTETPGFASPYHSIIAIGGALAWLKTKLNSQFAVQQINILTQDYLKMEKAIKEYYGLRFKDKKPRVGRAYSTYR